MWRCINTRSFERQRDGLVERQFRPVSHQIEKSLLAERRFDLRVNGDLIAKPICLQRDAEMISDAVGPTENDCRPLGIPFSHQQSRPTMQRLVKIIEAVALVKMRDALVEELSGFPQVTTFECNIGKIDERVSFSLTSAIDRVRLETLNEIALGGIEVAASSRRHAEIVEDARPGNV